MTSAEENEIFLRGTISVLLHIHTVRSLPGFYKVTQDLERKSQFLNNPHQQLVPEKKVLEGTVSQK